MRIKRFNRSSKRRILLHYKTEPYQILQRFKPNFHTNNQEIQAIVRSAITSGFGLDLIDRSERDWLPNDEYEIFISNASGDSGQYYTELIGRCPSAKKFLYALGPHPDVSNELVRRRYEEFKNRTNIKYGKMMRVFDKIDTDKYDHFSEIICMDNSGFSSSTYGKLAMPIRNILPSSLGSLSESNIQNYFEIRPRKLNKFLVFSGHGFIAKGIDLITESFLQNTNAYLDIVGPFEQDLNFMAAYQDRILKSSNIKLHGYMNINSRKFKSLCQENQWVIQASAAEGCSTSLVNATLRGLVPVSTWADGFDSGEFGLLLNKQNIQLLDQINNMIESCINFNHMEFNQKRENIKNHITKFSISRFENWWLKFFNG